MYFNFIFYPHPLIWVCTLVVCSGIEPIELKPEQEELLLRTYLNVGLCTGKWSTWKDRDNPSGTGDYEQLKDFPKTGDLCSDPLAVQARIIGTSTLATTEEVHFSLDGFFCRNDEQPRGWCSDYEVRFCCKAETLLAVGSCTGKWSSWKDRDNPSGNADNELLRYFPQTSDLCPKALAVQARIIGTSNLWTNENVVITLGGFLCRNSDQPSGSSCSDYEVRFCCKTETVLSVGSCTGRWSSWKDRDNPSGAGDFEQLKDFSKTGDLCSDPVAVQARIIGTTTLATSEEVNFSLNGFFCRNDQQPSGGCSDYEVRFCCKSKTVLSVGLCTGKWSTWKDRDNPSGNGDFEQLKDFPKTGDLCSDPIAAQARIIGTSTLATTEEVNFSLDGFFCRNDKQPVGICSDYEVRFCCKPETVLSVGSCTGKWSSWKDRDNPSGNADNELLRYFPRTSDLCRKPSAVQARIIGTTVLATNEIVEITLGGFLCRNSDQPSGSSCSDYEVRFCCRGWP